MWEGSRTSGVGDEEGCLVAGIPPILERLCEIIFLEFDFLYTTNVDIIL